MRNSIKTLKFVVQNSRWPLSAAISGFQILIKSDVAQLGPKGILFTKFEKTIHPVVAEK